MSGCPRVLVVGAGAAGTLTAIHLLRAAATRSAPLEIVLVDPAARWARGAAFGTTEPQHLLNVPACGMSALPEVPDDFVRWRRGGEPEPDAFAPRLEFAHYLDETLDRARQDAAGIAVLEHRHTRAAGLRTAPDGLEVLTTEGEDLPADAVVVATGLPAAGDQWAPPGLLESPAFVRDPWAPGALDAVRRDRSGPPDVLLVGTGLTMVDVTLSLAGPGGRRDRCILAISRSGRLPAPHHPAVAAPAVPDVRDWGASLAGIREQAVQHIDCVRRSTGDWRPGVDGIRHRVATLWARLDEADRAEFVTRDAARWNAVRHRMPPLSAARLRRLGFAGRLAIGTGQVRSAEPLRNGGVRVRLDDGSTREVGWVVNCTGPRADVRTLGDRFIDDLLRDRRAGALAVAATGGMGVRTNGGRVLDSNGATTAPLWTLGALRRGELWESTAVPEIREQAQAIATDILDAVAPVPRLIAG